MGSSFLVLLIALRLDLEASGGTTTTSALLLSTSGLSVDVGYSVLAVDATEVGESLAGMAGALEQNSLGASGALKGKLVESHDGAAGLLNAGTDGLSDVQGADGHLGDVQNTQVISDGTDNGENDAFLLNEAVGNQATDGHGGTVVAGEHQAAQDDLIEVGTSAAGQEFVQLHLAFRQSHLRSVFTATKAKKLVQAKMHS